MGLYINPKDESKESWLGWKGELLPCAPKSYKEGTKFAVCLVNNPAFSAAGVCYDQRELEDFADPTDPRHKFWFFVEEADIREVCGKGTNFYLDKAKD